MTGNDLKALLPGFVSSMAGIREVLDALTRETETLAWAAYNECRQLAASTASHRLDFWERELGLYPRGDLASDDRRALLLGALSFFGRCTPEDLVALFSQMTGGQAFFSEDPAQYTLSLSTRTPGRVVANLPSIAQVISRKAPAHLVCSLSAEGDMTASPSLHRALHCTVVLHVYAT